MTFQTDPNLDLALQFSGRTIFRRCLSCPDTLPKCPVCDADESCTATTRSCNECAATSCIKTSTLNVGTSTPSPPSGSDAGAIAGGVVGGVASVIIITVLVWLFIRKKRREMMVTEEYEKNEKSDRGQSRLSRRSMASIASTVLTRASNVIQIAYIPGVRSPPTTPSQIPPVPSIPSSHHPSSLSTPAFTEDQHFFLPSDLRDSTCSDLTVSVPRHSLSPSLARSSVATTIYRSHAIVEPIPAQQAMRGRAAVVSVHLNATSRETSSARTEAPAVPAITAAQLSKAGTITPCSSIVARSVVARPVNVTRSVSTKTKSPTVSDGETTDSARTFPPITAHKLAPAAVNKQASTFDDSSDEEEEKKDEAGKPKNEAVEGTATMAGDKVRTDRVDATHRSAALTVIEDSPAANQGPFSDTQQVNLNRPLVSDRAVSSGRTSMHSKSNSVHRHRSSHSSHRTPEETGSGSVLDASTPSGVSHWHSDSTTLRAESTTLRAESPFSDLHELKQ